MKTKTRKTMEEILEHLRVWHVQLNDKKLERMEKFCNVRISSKLPAPRISPNVAGKAIIIWKRN